jgi:protein-serine/threonine kinase
MAWEKEAHMTAGLCGSAPYIAPEEYQGGEFDPRAVDVWACGVIYMAMRTGRHLWRVARKEEDEFYERYLEGRRDEDGYAPIETLHRVSDPSKFGLLDQLLTHVFSGTLPECDLLHPGPESWSAYYRLPSPQVRMGPRNQGL